MENILWLRIINFVRGDCLEKFCRNHLQVILTSGGWSIASSTMKGAVAFAIVGSLVSQIGIAATPALETVEVRVSRTVDNVSFDGVVEAVRQTVIAAQISGEIVTLNVKPGDSVKAGQVLLRIDSHAADQIMTASEAQVSAAKVSLDIAGKEFDRQRQLFEKRLISQMAFERAEAEFKSSSAQAKARIAEASAARTQSGFFVIKAPYAGIVAKVPVVLGDMAMPGRELLTLYDPSAMRVTAVGPQNEISVLNEGRRQSIRIELPGQNSESLWLTPTHVQVLPTVDPSTHTMELRLDLPEAPLAAAPLVVTPGAFTRVWLATSTPNQTDLADIRLYVPTQAIVRRAEMTGLYVIDSNGCARLRQVRIGRNLKKEIEILSGINPGEKVALNPDAAARQPQ